MVYIYELTLEYQRHVLEALGGDFFITPDYDNNRIIIDFLSSISFGSPTINLTMTEILAQIGPGWIA